MTKSLDITNQTRKVIKRTRGQSHGAISRLMSPSDLGNLLKPFVFLDYVDAYGATLGDLGRMQIHPHSGIATVTVITEGYMNYEVASIGAGKIEYGGVEWLKAGNGVWHGKEMSIGDVTRLRAFQLWISLPPEMENSEPEGRFIEAKDMPSVGPAHVILGSHEAKQSPVPSPEGINYLLVSLKPGEQWVYQSPKGHLICWLSVAKGALKADEVAIAGDMLIFENSEEPLIINADLEGETVFVIGSAVPHPYNLYLGNYSVHTSLKALEMGENNIAKLGQKLRLEGNRKTDIGTTPVYR